MAEEVKTESIPVVEGLFTWPSDTPQLIGSKCRSCGSYYFPKNSSCNNPNCEEKSVEEIRFSTEGKLWSYTIIRYPSPPPFKSDKNPPYPLGLVELPEGIRVLGLITGCELEDLKIGMDMKLVVETLYRNEQGQGVLTWKFSPIL